MAETAIDQPTKFRTVRGRGGGTKRLEIRRPKNRVGYLPGSKEYDFFMEKLYRGEISYDDFLTLTRGS